MASGNFMSPYVQVFSELSESDANFAEGVAQFEVIMALWESDASLRDFLCSPAVNKDKRESILRKALVAAEVQDLVVRLLAMMIRKNSITYFPQYFKLLRVQADERLNIVRGVVDTAVKLDDKARETITKLLAKVSGKLPALKFVTDKKLIGGVRFRLKDMEVDATVLRKLDNAKSVLKKKRA